jgi:hypothetical protein
MNVDISAACELADTCTHVDRIRLIRRFVMPLGDADDTVLDILLVIAYLHHGEYNKLIASETSDYVTLTE